MVVFVFMVGKVFGFSPPGTGGGYKKAPPVRNRRGESQLDDQNPRGAPMMADTTTDERLEEPIRALIVATEDFITGRTEVWFLGIVHWPGGVRTERRGIVPVPGGSVHAPNQARISPK
jgi:hypothetical protein